MTLNLHLAAAEGSAHQTTVPRLGSHSCPLPPQGQSLLTSQALAEQGSHKDLVLHPATQQMLGVDKTHHLGYSPGAGAE